VVLLPRPVLGSEGTMAVATPPGPAGGQLAWTPLGAGVVVAQPVIVTSTAVRIPTRAVRRMLTSTSGEPSKRRARVWGRPTGEMRRQRVASPPA
jgi:hypothetical protein